MNILSNLKLQLFQHFLLLLLYVSTSIEHSGLQIGFYIACVLKIFSVCYLRITWPIKYVGYLCQILVREDMLKCKAYFFLFWYWNLILIQPEFDLSAAVTKRYYCTQQDVHKTVGNSLANALSRARHSRKNHQAAEEESYPGEIELKNEGSNMKIEDLHKF